MATRQVESSQLARQALTKQHVLELLSGSKPILQARFGVSRLALFGSTARDTATSSSDVDILVAFDGPATSQRYFGVQFYLEDLLNSAVDLVTEKALRPELRPYIEKECLNVWDRRARVAFLSQRHDQFCTQGAVLYRWSRPTQLYGKRGNL